MRQFQLHTPVTKEGEMQTITRAATDITMTRQRHPPFLAFGEKMSLNAATQAALRYTKQPLSQLEAAGFPVHVKRISFVRSPKSIAVAAL